MSKYKNIVNDLADLLGNRFIIKYEMNYGEHSIVIRKKSTNKKVRIFTKDYLFYELKSVVDCNGAAKWVQNAE